MEHLDGEGHTRTDIHTYIHLEIKGDGALFPIDPQEAATSHSGEWLTTRWVHKLARGREPWPSRDAPRLTALQWATQDNKLHGA